jgi:hypothetical protein
MYKHIFFKWIFQADQKKIDCKNYADLYVPSGSPERNPEAIECHRVPLGDPAWTKGGNEKKKSVKINLTDFFLVINWIN